MPLLQYLHCAGNVRHTTHTRCSTRYRKLHPTRHRDAHSDTSRGLLSTCPPQLSPSSRCQGKSSFQTAPIFRHFPTSHSLLCIYTQSSRVSPERHPACSSLFPFAIFLPAHIVHQGSGKLSITHPENQWLKILVSAPSGLRIGHHGQQMNC